jgi:urea carboxylase-associated protein 1
LRGTDEGSISCSPTARTPCRLRSCRLSAEGEEVLQRQSSQPGRQIIDDTVVVPGGYWSRILKSGQILQIIDLEGCQAVDLICYNANDYTDRYSSSNTIKMNESIFITKGSKLYSDDANVLMSVTDDTYGRHDTICGSCNGGTNRVRYGITKGPSCRNNFISALAEHGMTARDIVPNVNVFMYLPVGPEGEMPIVGGKSKPGERFELTANMDVLVVFSNCPQTNNAVNDYKLTPVQATVFSS